MKTSTLLTIAFQAFTVANAASPCRKDACYSAVAVQQNDNPRYAVRREDCSSVLKTVFADEKTVTVTRTTTAGTTFAPNPQQVDKRTAAPEITAAPQLLDTRFAFLEEREQVVAGGRKPDYASECKALKQYATACLCIGVRASTYLPGPTKTVTKTVTVATPYRGPSCDFPSGALGQGGCSQNCFCDPRGPGIEFGACDSAYDCNGSCATDADCDAGFLCLIGGAADNCGGSTCAAFTDCSSTFDPAAGSSRSGRKAPVPEAVARFGRFGSS